MNHNIKIITCYNKKWWAILSRLIRVVQKTDYSHFAIWYDNRNLYHATGKGIHKTYWTDFFNEYEIVARHTIEIKDDPRVWLESQIGIKYGVMQIIGLWLMELKIFKRNPWTKGVVCNEFVLMLMDKFTDAKIKDKNDYDLNDTLELVKCYSSK